MSGKPCSPLLPYLDQIHALRASGTGWPEIHAALLPHVPTVTRKGVQEFYAYHKARIGLPAPVQAVIHPPARPKDINDVLTLPPRPFAVPVPKPAAPAILKGWQRTLAYGDTHFPYQDDPTLAVVASVAKALQPERLLHVGDLVDCYTISSFLKDPNRLYSLQDEIDLARAHLHQMAQLVPDAERWLLEGNHEDRLRKTLWSLPGGAAELARLRSVQQATEWPALLGLEAIGFRWVPTHQQTQTTILPKLITKHGTVVRKWSGWTAKGEWERYGKGGISGHTHRLGKFYHRDHNGSHLWVETGCTCTLRPDYMVDPDWQQGCVVITHTPDGERYHVEEVYIQDGAAVFRGQLFKAAA